MIIATSFRLRPAVGRRALEATIVAMALASCVATGSAAPSSQPAGSFPPSPVDGVVVAVDSQGIGNVRGFTLRLPGGATIQMSLGTLENAAQFAPGHLSEHEATGLPVRVYFVVNGNVPTVYRLEDAPRAT